MSVCPKAQDRPNLPVWQLRLSWRRATADILRTMVPSEQCQAPCWTVRQGAFARRKVQTKRKRPELRTARCASACRHAEALTNARRLSIRRRKRDRRSFLPRTLFCILRPSNGKGLPGGCTLSGRPSQARSRSPHPAPALPECTCLPPWWQTGE